MLETLKNPYNKYILPAFVALNLGILSLANTASAEVCPPGFTPSSGGVTCVPSQGRTGLIDGNLSNYGILGIILLVFRYALIFAGIVAVGYIIMGGFKTITAGGDGDKYKEGINYIKNAAIGLAIVLLALAIVRIITNTVLDVGTGGNIIR